MQINWFTIIAQVINFLILVWLLKRFLYKPILKAIDDREKKIASELSDAKAKMADAKKEQDEFSKKNEEFEQKKKDLMDKAVADTKEQREKLLDSARDEAELLRSKYEKALKTMQENMDDDIAQRTQEEVFAIARKTLTDLASVSLEEQAVNIFISRLNDLKKEEKKQFIDAFESGSTPVLIQSSFELPVKQQNEIKSTVNEILDSKKHYTFKTAPELISGIEIASDGYKLAWNISEYLSSLQKSISEMVKEKREEETKKEDEKKQKDEDEKKPKEEHEKKPKDEDEKKPKEEHEKKLKIEDEKKPKEEHEKKQHAKKTT